MKVEVGKRYKNKIGEKIFIERKVDNTSIYRALGSILPYFVCADGKHIEHPNGMLSLIAEWSVIDEMKRQDKLAQDGVKLDLNKQRKMNNEEHSKLRDILDRAYEQAASGKGKERHANGRPFDKQPIAEIGRMVGTGYNLGQVMKKAQEAQGMANRGEIEAAVREVLGVINYAASAVMLWEED